MIRNIFSSLFGFAAIVVSFILGLTYAFNNSIFNADFYNGDFDQAVHKEVVSNLEGVFSEDDQLVVFPDTIKKSISSEELAEIFLKYYTVQDTTEIIESVKSQFKESVGGGDSFTLTIPLTWIEANREKISADIVEKILLDLPECESFDDFSPVNLNCKPVEVYGDSINEQFEILISRNYLARIPREMPLTIATGNNQVLSQLVTNSSLYLESKAEVSMFLLFLFLILAFISALIIFSPFKIALRRFISVLLSASILNLITFLSLYYTFTELPDQDIPLRGLMEFFVRGVTSPMLHILIPAVIILVLLRIAVWIWVRKTNNVVYDT